MYLTFSSFSPPPPQAPPLPPDMVRVESVGSSWINISWTAVENYPAIQDYQLEYRLSALPSSDWSRIERIMSVLEIFNITMLYPSALYAVRVRARSPLGEGEYSPAVMATTREGIPQDGLVSGPDPDGIRFIFTSPNNVTVSWIVPEVTIMFVCTCMCTKLIATFVCI